MRPITSARKFTGQERDSETGIDFFHARYFGAALGRFTSPDPANAGADITNPQSWNAYAYVLGNPLALVDSSGLDAFGNGGDDGGDPCFEDPFLCGAFPPISFPTPEPPAPPPPPTTTESASSGPPLPPGSFPGGETLGLPPGMNIPGPLSWQVLLGLYDWYCSSGVCVPRPENGSLAPPLLADQSRKHNEEDIRFFAKILGCGKTTGEIVTQNMRNGAVSGGVRGAASGAGVRIPVILSRSVIGIMEGAEEGSFAGPEGALVGGIVGGTAGAMLGVSTGFAKAAACKALGF